MSLFAMLPPGSAVIAKVDFGPIVRGQWGIVTGHRPGTWLPWRRTAYVCAFLGGISMTTTRSQIVRHEHGFTCDLLNDPLWFLHTRDVPLGACNVPATTRSNAADAT